MKRKFLSIILFFCAVTGQLPAQEPPVSDLVFDKLVHDFGDILLSDGKKNCTFTYTNKGSKPIVIQTVIPSCGCTDPKWDKAPIMPGKSGTIQVTYSNDQGPYPFDKTIAVYSTASDTPVTLRIRGVVHEKKKSLSELFPIAYGDLRLKNVQYHAGQIAQGETKTDSVQIANGGKSTIEVSFKNVSKGLAISVHPKKIKPGEKGSLRYTIDTRIAPDWGSVSYAALPVVNGVAANVRPVEIVADIRDNFKNHTHEQLANAPILLAENTHIRFDDVKRGALIEKKFSFTNKGKSPLILHKAIPANDYTTVTLPKEIAPEKSGVITLTIDSAKLTGEVVTGVTIITNVPSRPAISLMVSGVVVP